MKELLVLVEACDFESAPVGGQLSFCKQVISSIDDPIFLIGVATGAEPIGCWYECSINGKKYQRFNLYKLSGDKKPRIPLRIQTLFALLRYKKRIVRSAKAPFFINSPEAAIALFGVGRLPNDFYYIFHGVENPLVMPRYKWGRLFVKPFDLFLKRALAVARTILVCADESGVKRIVDNYSATQPNKVIQFPTRYNDSIFKHTPRTASNSSVRLVSTGRINQVKGWDLILDAFKVLCEISPDVSFELVFVGDGEDRQRLEERAKHLGVFEKIRITGFVSADIVSDELNNADLVLVGSYKEGWSIAMLEALASGRNLISTNVSGAYDLIDVGVNGFVVDNRDPHEYAQSILNAITHLPAENERSIAIAAAFKMSDFKDNFIRALQFER